MPPAALDVPPPASGAAPGFNLPFGVLMFRKFAVGGFVAFVVAASLTLGVAAPAQAVQVGIDKSWDLWRYVLTIKSSQLAATMGPAALAAWKPEFARAAAAQAYRYTPYITQGLIDPVELAEVIPIDKPRDPGPGKPRKWGMPKLPAFSASQFFKLTSTGVANATIAATAFAMRGDVAGGVTDLFGVDAQGAVCEYGGAGKFVEWLSGQDCSPWHQPDGYSPNNDLILGRVYDEICTTEARCVKFLGYTAYDANNSFMCWKASNFTSGGGVDFGSGWTFNVLLGSIPPNPNTWTGPHVLATSGSRITACNSHLSGIYAAAITSGKVMGGSGQLPNWQGVNGYRLVKAGQPTITGGYATVEADAERWLVCRITGSNGTVYTGPESARFRESDGEFPTPVCPTTPTGVWPTRAQVIEYWAGGNSVLYDQAADPAYLDWQANDKALCTSTDCILDLVTVSNGISCFGQVAACDGWMTSPTRDADYRCEYGGQPEPIQECYVYAQTFNEQLRLDGYPYSDPRTGDELDSGAISGLRYDEQLMGRPAQNPGAVRACGGSTTAGMNPLDWVLRPITCALEWAFVPRPSAIAAEVAEFETAWAGSSLGQVSTLVGGFSIDVGAVGCKRTLDFPIPWNDPVPVDVINGCPGSLMAPVVPLIRLLINVGTTVFVLVLLRRYLAATVDFRP